MVLSLIGMSFKLNAFKDFLSRYIRVQALASLSIQKIRVFFKKVSALFNLLDVFG